jgi:hypothetical protein
MVIRVRVEVRFVCLFGINLIDRDQWHSQITHFFQQSMQCSLIDPGANQKRIAVGLERDGHAAEPVCSVITEMAFDPDVIDHAASLSGLGSFGILLLRGDGGIPVFNPLRIEEFLVSRHLTRGLLRGLHASKIGIERIEKDLFGFARIVESTAVNGHRNTTGTFSEGPDHRHRDGVVTEFAQKVCI